MKSKANISNYLNLIAIILIIYFMISFKLPCPIKSYTGISCPFCGLIDAFNALINKDISLAFKFYPLFWLIPIYLVIMLFSNKIPNILIKIFKLLTFLLIIGLYLYRLFIIKDPYLSLDFINSSFYKTLMTIKEVISRII